MRKPRLTDEQIVALLRAAGRSENNIADICRKAGVSEQTFYQLRNKFAGSNVRNVRDVRKLEQLEKDNARLLRLLMLFLEVASISPGLVGKSLIGSLSNPNEPN